MLSVLIKKQFQEIISIVFYDAKRGERRSTRNLIIMSLLMLYVVGVILFMFFQMANGLSILIPMGLDWYYFDYMALVATMFGIFGSVFSTYSSVFLSKDNELLLSMPISQFNIVFSRLIGVYVMGIIYISFAYIPMMTVYFLTTGFQITIFMAQIAMLLVLSFVVLSLSAILGWGVAIISVHLHNKSFLILFISLAFLGLYFYGYSKLLENINSILIAIQETGQSIQASGSIIYSIGQAFTGSILPIGLCLFVSILLVCLVFFMINNSFTRIVTINKGERKTAYNEKSIQKKSVAHTLFIKEFRRFISSANYMMNCSLATIMMPISGVFILVKRQMLMDMLSEFHLSNGLTLLLALAAIVMMTSANDISTPSISLEGKTIWIYQVLPIDGWDILKAKSKVHLAVTIPPLLFLIICLEMALQFDVVSILILIVISCLFVLLQSFFGLVLGLLMPNLNWSNEIVVIKQSMNVYISLFGCWAIVLVLGIVYYLLKGILSPFLFIGILFLVIVILDAFLYYWLKNKGAKIIMKL